ncbi:MAG: pyridoxal-phosphate dependent enzyme, partial [Anaerolineae bacterium]
MPKEIALKCTACQYQMPYRLKTGHCPNCGSDWLDPRYALPSAKRVWAAELAGRAQTMWRYWELLPLLDQSNIVSMGEGCTPLLPLTNLGLMLGCPNIYLKDERQGPTGSFKDRQASLAVSVFKESDITEVVVASTGNVAISYSAYSARAGIKLWAFLTSTVPQDKMRESILYGTEVVKVTATYDQTKAVARQFADRKGFFLDKGVKNIAAKESMKTVAFEIAEQLGLMQTGGSGRPFAAPDWYIQTISGGLGPVGVWKGFCELKEMGVIDKLPRLALIQAEGCAPMVNSFRAGLAEAEPVTDPRTLITTVATGSPGPVYPYLRNIILTHGGHMDSVPDNEAFRAMHVMAQMEGLSMEPAAAMACAGLFKMVKQQIIRPHETVVVNCSGHTFPVEKHLLDERRLQALDPACPAAPETGEGVLTALDNLDDRVKHIAIIEDDPNAARLLRRILQAKGNYTITQAADGLSGLELSKQERPDLVLLDLMMPGLDGFSLLDRMKANPTLQHIPVIAVTARSLTLSDRQRLSGRVDGLLKKGAFEEEDLL